MIRNLPHLHLIENAVLYVIKYYHVFSHVLKAPEILFFLGVKSDRIAFEQAMDKLVKDRQVFKLNDFYSVVDDVAKIEARIKAEQNAKPLIANAQRIGKFIGMFPFVRFVGLSGSLSKGVAYGKDDLDYFIITQKDRLWISRTLLHLFKKCTFLVGKQHNFCMNYFIDEEALEISEKNYFTATEIATLKPLFEEISHSTWLQSNLWILDFLPNYILPNSSRTQSISSLKRGVEFFLEIFPLNTWNIYLQKMTDASWRKTWVKKGNDIEKYAVYNLMTNRIAKTHKHKYREKLNQLITSR